MMTQHANTKTRTDNYGYNRQQTTMSDDANSMPRHSQQQQWHDASTGTTTATTATTTHSQDTGKQAPTHRKAT
jgi:hypothetical protein